MTTQSPRTINEPHCQACGTTARGLVGYDAVRRNDGYTRCCNERVVAPGTDVYGRRVWPCATDCYHR